MLVDEMCVFGFFVVVDMIKDMSCDVIVDLYVFGICIVMLMGDNLYIV